MSSVSNRMRLSREEIKEIFREHDIDGDGHLSMHEVMKAFGFIGCMLPYHKAHYGMALADADGDGLIDEDELERLVDYAERFQNRKRCG